MALVSAVAGDQLPLLPPASSPASASSPETPDQAQPPVAVCWSLHVPAGCTELQAETSHLPSAVTVTPPLQHQCVSSTLSTDSGCESDGVADSAYSTVTSCTSDVIRMQLDTEMAEAAEQPPWREPEPPELPPPLQEKCGGEGGDDDTQAQHIDDYRVRSWSLEARGSLPDAIVAEVPSPPPPLLPPLRHSQSEPSLAASASTASMPICRICHMPSEERSDLISPCRCAGTMQFIHTSCLMHWIEVSSRRAKRAPQCELCQYQYQRHKRFRMGRWLVPAVSCRDKLLHSLFLISAVVMITCAVVTIFCFKQDSGKRRHLYDEAELTTSEKWTLVCGILFFAAFFVGMYSQIKARYSLYHLVARLFYLNQQWLIDQYDRSKDEKYRSAHTATFAV